MVNCKHEGDPPGVRGLRRHASRSTCASTTWPIWAIAVGRMKRYLVEATSGPPWIERQLRLDVGRRAGPPGRGVCRSRSQGLRSGPGRRHRGGRHRAAAASRKGRSRSATNSTRSAAEPLVARQAESGVPRARCSSLAWAERSVTAFGTNSTRSAGALPPAHRLDEFGIHAEDPIDKPAGHGVPRNMTRDHIREFGRGECSCQSTETRTFLSRRRRTLSYRVKSEQDRRLVLRPSTPPSPSGNASLATPPELGVEPGDLPNASEGSSVAEGAVGAPLVVVAHPVWQRCSTRLA
jgi:hypothetical protein